MSNLPDWPGADSVYDRLGKAAGWLAAHEHKAWCESRVGKVKLSKRMVGFKVSQDVQWIVDALGRGDEEECKGLLCHRWVIDALKQMK